MKLPALVLAGVLASAAVTLVTSPAADAAGSTAASAAVERAGREAAERKVVRLTNKKRTAHGCDPLKVKKTIRKAARQHSERMADAGELSHQLPDEPDVGQRLTDAGYDDWTSWGENIATGYTTAREVVSAWMESPGHRANILDCDFEHIGVGLVGHDGTKWWTQDFGAN